MRLGAMVHFPAKSGPVDGQTQAQSDEEWRLAWLACDAVRRDLGAGSHLRWDGLWHESDWEPWNPYGWERNVRILEGLRSRGLRPLLGLIPNPWPGSGWGPSPAGWGAFPETQRPLIAERLAARVEGYRSEIARLGWGEAECALQIGNEPATPHPGGDPRGEDGGWSSGIRRNLSRCYREIRPGGLEVIGPAFSKQDHAPAIALRERQTAVLDAEWARRVDRLAYHHRWYAPGAASPAAYARGWVDSLRSRSQVLLGLGLPEAPGARRRLKRAASLCVTESYVASGDAPGGLAGVGPAWRAVVGLLLAEPPPEVDLLILYRYWHRSPIPGGLRWDVPENALLGVRG